MRWTASTIVLVILLVGMLIFPLNIQPVRSGFVLSEVVSYPSIPPAIQDFYVNNTWANSVTQFAFNVSDSMGALDHAIFGCNVTGSWVNDANTSLSGAVSWANYTKTLPNSNCIVMFNFTVWNTNSTINATTGPRVIKAYTYNSTAGAWNTPFNCLGDALETIENANDWGTVETYVQTVLGQQPISALGTMIDNFMTPSANEAYVYCGADGGVWTNPTYAYNNVTTNAASIAWSSSGYCAPLTLNLTTTARGTKIQYLVQRNYATSNQITTMRISIANNTGSWFLAFTGAPTWNKTTNATIPLSQYTRMQINFSKTGSVSRTAYINETQAINQSTSAIGDWCNILKWSAFCNKLNITRQSAIKNALANYTMIDHLPWTTNNSYIQCFGTEQKWGLYGFYYNAQSWMGAYQNNTKWNITAAYQQFNNSIYNSGQPVLWIYADWTTFWSDRFYDEGACTIACYVLFEKLLNVSGAINDALHWWDYINTNYWSLSYGGYYKYTSISSDPAFECEAGFFLKIISILKYDYPSLQNWTRVLTDIGNRFLGNKWNSTQWLDSYNATAYVVVHMYLGNEQRRLSNTVGAWQALLGVYLQLNSTYENNLKDMLYGNNNTEPAWALLLRPEGNLYDDASKLFRGGSDSGVNNNASAWAEILLFMMGIVPDTTTIAFPLEELGYEYYYDVDPNTLQLQINASLRQIAIPVNSNGSMTLQYGISPINQNFSQKGVWQITFTDSWNMITSVQFLGSLPNNVIYFTDIYAMPPYNNITHDANAMWIEPSTVQLNTIKHSIGYKFNVTLWLNLTTGCKGWQFKLLYDKNYLDALRVGYTAGDKSEFLENITTMPVSPKFGSHNDTHDYVFYGEAWIMGPVRGPSYGSLAWVEFNVVAIPSEGEEEYSATLDISANYPYQTFALDENDEKIPLTTYDSLYIFTWIPPNLAILDVKPYRTTIGQGYLLSINVTVENQGYQIGLLNVTVYTNGTEIQTISATVGSGNISIILFTWNTTSFAFGTYTISAYVHPFPQEANITDNYFVDGTVEIVFLPYDVTGDGYVGIDDIVAVAEHFGTQPPNWNSIYDVTGDDYVGIDDIVATAEHFGQTCP